MKNKTVLMTAILAVTTVLAAGLTVLPSSIQEAQADVCTVNQICIAAIGNDIDIEDSANLGSLQKLPYPGMVASEGISVPPFSDDSD
jgi:aspartate ammonia-lyase